MPVAERERRAEGPSVARIVEVGSRSRLFAPEGCVFRSMAVFTMVVSGSSSARIVVQKVFKVFHEVHSGPI